MKSLKEVKNESCYQYLKSLYDFHLESHTKAGIRSLR